MFCPKCGASTEVESSAQSAACSACGEALPVNLPKFGPPALGPTPQAFGLDEMAAAQPVAPPPQAFAWREQRAPDGAWLVTIPERGLAAFAFVFFGSIGGAAYVFGTSARVPPFGVVLALGALWFGYRTLCAVANRGTLRIDREAVSFRRGPVPQLGAFRVALGDVATFQLVRGPTMTSRGVTTVWWTIQAAHLLGLQSMRMPWMNRDQAEAVVRRLIQMLADARKQAGLPPPQPPTPF